jgi:hypothetical protein
MASGDRRQIKFPVSPKAKEKEMIDQQLVVGSPLRN